MRSDMIKNNYWNLEDAIEIIENGIKEQLRPTEISMKLKAKLEVNPGINYKYFNDIFNSTTGYTLAQYIRRRALTITYEKWKKEQPKLCKNSNFKGYPRFPKSFQDEFEITIEEAAKESYTERKLQMKLDITGYVELLESMDEIKRSKLIKDYLFNNKQTLTMEFDSKELLLFHLQMDVYVLPYLVFQAYENASIEEKALVVASFDKLCQSKCKEYTVEITKEECEAMCARLIDYDFCKMGELLLVVPKPIPGLKKTFYEMCDDLLPSIYSTLPAECFSPDIAKELNLIEKSADMNQVSSALKKDFEQTLELIWDYLERGYLRVILLNEISDSR